MELLKLKRGKDMRLKSLPLKDIKINEDYWLKHIDLVRKVIIPYQWEAMNDQIEGAESSHCLENFMIAAGRKKGEFYGAVFQDTDIAKWLEAVGFTLASYKDRELEETADEVIKLIGEAQGEDGYLNTYFTIKEPDKRWKDLGEGHELYTAGHMMEAAVAYYKGTGKRAFLDMMIRNADLICEIFGPNEGQIHGYPGHQEVELGLYKLYEVTGTRKYLEMAKYFIEKRGVGENYFLHEMHQPGYHYIFPEFVGYDPRYSQSHLPVREQNTAEGHAVRATYMYAAMADLANAYGDESLLKACKNLWDNIVNKRMYITGGIGSSGILERFTTDYDLPNEYNYAESCASIGLMLFGLKMAQITKTASYIDVVEKALYNTVLAGIALDGKSFFYVNPLEVWPEACINRTSKEHVKPIRQKWFGVACCPPNIARTLASLGQYIWAIGEETLFLNLFIGNETTVKIGEKEINVVLNTRFPIENKLEIRASEKLKLAIRIPSYATKDSYKLMVEGKRTDYEIKQGYAYVSLEENQVLSVTFEAPARFIYANPSVRADIGKVAIQRGPLVYCLEETDNGKNLSALFVNTDEPIIEEISKLGGEVITLKLKGKRMKYDLWSEQTLYAGIKPTYEEVYLKAVPYAYWGNRKKGEMLVWMHEFN